MDPILTVLRFGDVERPLGTFGLMVALGVLVTCTLAARTAWRLDLDVGRAIASFGFTAAGSLLGAFSLFVLVERLRTGAWIDPRVEGGLVFYGAPIGGGLAFWLSCRGFGLPFARLVDAAVHAIPAGHAIGRLGCFFGGCCFGRPVEEPSAALWAVRYTHWMAPASEPSVLRHATPLYESAALLLVAFALALWPPGRVGDGGRLGLYCVLYALVRSSVELFRGDHVRGVWALGLSTSQWISIGTAAFGFALLARARASAGRLASAQGTQRA